VGLHFEVVEADTAEETGDGRSLEFFNMDAFTDTLESVVKWTNNPPENMPPARMRAELLEFLRTIGKVKVASFDKENVYGHFMGLRANVDASFRPADDDI